MPTPERSNSLLPMRLARNRWTGAIIAVAVGAVGLLATTATAKPVVVGTPFDTEFTKLIRATTAATFSNLSLAKPEAFVTSPTDGAIVDFAFAGAQGGPYRIRVLRPLGGNVYLGAGTSNDLSIEPPESSVIKPLPIERGDAIGVDLQPGLTLAAAEPSGGSTTSWVAPLADGESRAYGSVRSPRELGFNVTVLPPPKVLSIRPRSVNLRHPREVTIVGENLLWIRNVYFGGRKARLLRFKSERRIVVLPPWVKSPRQTRIAVQTSAGTSPRTGAAKFAYTAPKHK